MNECLAADDRTSFDQLHELIGDADDRVALAQFQNRRWPTTVLWWPCPPPANAHRVASPWIERQDGLDAQVVLPAIGEVVFVDEPLADAQSKIGQMYVPGMVTKADPASAHDCAQ